VVLLASALTVVMPGGPASVASADDPPPPPPGAKSAVSISSNCAATSEGEVWCWGENWAGDLGNGQRGTNSYDNIHSSVPVKVPGLTGIVEVTKGHQRGVCARNEAGTVWCWGDNGISQTGFDE
jgi:alpha-tubulin suppressor-like RCC1 family protein